MNRKALFKFIVLLLIYAAATYYSFKVDNTVIAVALQCLTNIASAGIGALLMFLYIFIFKLPH